MAVVYFRVHIRVYVSITTTVFELIIANTTITVDQVLYYILVMLHSMNMSVNEYLVHQIELSGKI
jgi:hypothetical protein